MIETLCSLGFVAWLFSACTAMPGLHAGYVEGEFSALAPVATARITALHVRRGDRVEVGTLVATLEDDDARHALQEATATLAEAEASLADIRKGKRPEEIAAIEAALESARAQAREAALALARRQDMFAKGYAPEADVDKAKATADSAQARVKEISANLATARLPARPDQVHAAEERVARARAGLAMARWQLEQRQVRATVAGRVYDILRRPGETAGPTVPVVSVLPDGGVKLRFYVPEGELARVKIGDTVTATCDGCAQPVAATVSYVAHEAQFTPPVIYSINSRQKLVYLIEARPEGGADALRPGQIVDVRLDADTRP